MLCRRKGRFNQEPEGANGNAGEGGQIRIPRGGEIRKAPRLTLDPKDPLTIHGSRVGIDSLLRNDARDLQPNWEAIHFYSWPQIVARLAGYTGLGTGEPVCESHN